MRIIAIDEKDIKVLLDKLKLKEHEAKERYKSEHSDLITLVHKSFHYELVKFFQNQGSGYPGGGE